MNCVQNSVGCIIESCFFYYERERNTACLTHGFTKEGAVPDSEIDYAIEAKRLVDKDRNRYTVEWEL